MSEFSPEYLKQLSQMAETSGVSKKPLAPIPFEEQHRVLGGALRVLDFIERPYYSAMNVAKDLVGGEKGFHPFTAVGRGLTGKERTNFGEVLTEAGWQPTGAVGKFAKGAVSFAGGVLFDPLTYLTAGTVKVFN